MPRRGFLGTERFGKATRGEWAETSSNIRFSAKAYLARIKEQALANKKCLAEEQAVAEQKHLVDEQALVD